MLLEKVLVKVLPGAVSRQRAVVGDGLSGILKCGSLCTRLRKAVASSWILMKTLWQSETQN